MNKEVTLAELKLIVDRQDKELQGLATRNVQLEKYIKSKKLPLPSIDGSLPSKEEEDELEKKKTDEQYEGELKKLEIKIENCEIENIELNREIEKKVFL